MRYGLWKPIPEWVGGTRKWASRSGTKPRAIVIHRMEGSLEGSDSYLRREFADYYPYPRLTATTHFGVGLWLGVPQIRQWVDTAYSAFGWAASPTDIPDALGKRLFSDLMYSKATWPYYQSRIDLNRAVISIEVEGFAYQRWDSATTAKVRELIGAIVMAHGPLTIATHTCLSSKQCPGMATFTAAMPGYYGAKIGAPAPLPDTSTKDVLPVRFSPIINRRFLFRKGTTWRTSPKYPADNALFVNKEDTWYTAHGYVPGSTLSGSSKWVTRWRKTTKTSDSFWEGRWVYAHEQDVIDMKKAE